jgi:hypothetical protein
VKGVYALYRTGADAQRAVDRLRGTGVPDSRITVITGEPMENFEFSHIGRANKLWFVASGGGLFGMIFGVWLTWFISTDWPMNVGNMPTVSWFPNLIIVFELTMLSAILATVVALVGSSGLLRRCPALYDPEVTNGKILVGIEDLQAGSEEAVENALRVRPDVTLKTV